MTKTIPLQVSLTNELKNQESLNQDLIVKIEQRNPCEEASSGNLTKYVFEGRKFSLVVSPRGLTREKVARDDAPVTDDDDDDENKGIKSLDNGYPIFRSVTFHSATGEGSPVDGRTISARHNLFGQ